MEDKDRLHARRLREREKLDPINATETKHHSHHNYAVSIQLTQARPHNTLYLD